MLLSLPWTKVFAGASGWFSSYTIRPRLIKQEVSAFNFLSGARVNFTLTVYHYCTTSCGDNGDGVGGKACSSLKKKKRTFRPDSNHWLLAEWNAPRSIPSALKPLWLSIVWCQCFLEEQKSDYHWCELEAQTVTGRSFCCCCWHYFNKF